MSDMHTTGQEWDGAPPDVDLGRVWRAVATEVWRRQPSWLERRVARWLGSPGLARALLTTPSLLVAWLISTVVVLGVGAAATVGTGLPLVALLAPAVAGQGSPTCTVRERTRPGSCHAAWRSTTGWCYWCGHWRSSPSMPPWG